MLDGMKWRICALEIIKKAAFNTIKRCFCVSPKGVEPISTEPESAILSIKLQGHASKDILFHEK